MRLDIFLNFEHKDLKTLILNLITEIQLMSQQLDDLTAAVTSNNDLIGSAITLIRG